LRYLTVKNSQGLLQIKMMKKYLYIPFILSMFVLHSCKNNHQENPALYIHPQQQCLHNLTAVIVYDIFNPPVASRIYAYSNLAYYEAIRWKDSNSNSIIEKMKGFTTMPAPEKNMEYDFTLAAIKAFYKVGKALVFSKDSLAKSESTMLASFKNALTADAYNNSIAFGDSVAAIILKRSTTDNYKQSRGKPKLNVYNTNGKWQQTPPDYLDAIEPNWSILKPFLLDSAAQFTPPPPPAYNLDKKSEYYKQLMELYTLTKNLTPQQDSIARYWDDNAFVTQYEGHMIYANKKTTPPGHWMGIVSILTKQKNSTETATAKSFALTASAMFDGFIACWYEKYKSLTVRPITVIQENIERDWEPILQTPPFPEYISGHSVISAAAATILAKQYGSNVAFMDTTEMKYLGMRRFFLSVNDAAAEVSISRMYGGIHYKAAINEGVKQGQQIGQFYVAAFYN